MNLEKRLSAKLRIDDAGEFTAEVNINIGECYLQSREYSGRISDTGIEIDNPLISPERRQLLYMLINHANTPAA